VTREFLPAAPLLQEAVFGPVVDSRFGRHLGVNPLPAGVKVCGFNCNFCDLDWTFELIDDETLGRHSWRRPEEIAGEFRRGLERTRDHEPSLDRAVIAGNGEPTLHPEFYELCRLLVEARDEEWPGLELLILSNSAALRRPQVVPGLLLLDRRVMRLDAGTEGLFLGMNSPTFDLRLEEVLRDLEILGDFEIQTMFTRGRRDNTADEAVEAWIEAVARVRPSRVRLHTVTRPPADGKVTPVDREKLEQIARRLEERAGIAAVVEADTEEGTPGGRRS